MVEAAASWWLPWWLGGGSPFQDSRDATSLQSQGQSRREGQRVQEGQEGAKDGAATAKKR